jgi:integrase/recombinase XerD
MSRLRELLHDYVTMRRALGFKLHSDGTALSTFVAFMEQEQADTIRTDLALAWAKLPKAVQPARWAQRLSYVRGFARYCQAFDERTEIPSSQLLPFPRRSPRPYFFTDEAIETLLQATLQLPAKDKLINHTYHCLFGLLSVAGLRISEALALTVDDVDLDQGILTLRSTKFGKSRLVPLHATSVAVLANYQRHRDQFLSGRTVSHWFINKQGARLHYDSVNDVFHRLTAALPEQSGRRRPRLHDLRHHFAIATVVRWYREGQDVERRLPVLSAFLGHVEVQDTYWYLSACTELLDAAKDRLERRWESVS